MQNVSSVCVLRVRIMAFSIVIICKMHCIIMYDWIGWWTKQFLQLPLYEMCNYFLLARVVEGPRTWGFSFLIQMPTI